MNVAVVSLKFSPGHMGHLQAYKALFENISDRVTLFLAPDYCKLMGQQDGMVYTEDIKRIVGSKPDLVFIYNISLSNLTLIDACKSKGIRTIYVLHEPRGSFKELLAEGEDIVKTLGANFVNSLICRKVDKVLLASETGRKNYCRYMSRCNKNYAVFPLILGDEYDSSKIIERRYFSFIGGFSEVHACKEFLEFVKYGLKNNKNLHFLIATKTDISEYMDKPIFRKALKSGRLKVQAGRPMSGEEINEYYRQSICVWNAYNRSTQSSVLSHALMLGTPVIVNDNGAAKEVMSADKRAGCFINMPPDNDKIMKCYLFIHKHIEEMEKNARQIFKERYCYSSFIELAKQIIIK